MKNFSFFTNLFWLRLLLIFLIGVILALSWSCWSTFGEEG